MTVAPSDLNINLSHDVHPVPAGHSRDHNFKICISEHKKEEECPAQWTTRAGLGHEAEGQSGVPSDVTNRLKGETGGHSSLDLCLLLTVDSFFTVNNLRRASKYLF